MNTKHYYLKALSSMIDVSQITNKVRGIDANRYGLMS